LRKTRFAILATLLATLVVLVIPAGALAVTGPNAFGQTFAGQAACVPCHSGGGAIGVAPAYGETRHGLFVVDVTKNPENLIPGTGSGQWPSPSGGEGGLQFNPQDLFITLGAPDVVQEYVANYKGGGVVNSLGQMIPKVKPADDYPLMDPVVYSPELGEWEAAEGPVGVAAYFQRCSGCHHLGVTRPSATAVTLASGAVIDPSTPTTWAGLGIQCENCHGTGSTASPHMGVGVGVTGMPRVLSSELCGQCHASGTTVEKRFASTSSFSNANGYTTNLDLADFFTLFPATDARYYPSGHNKSMNHVYYNEWVLSGHSDSRANLKDAEGKPLPYASASCMHCMSAEGYLKASGYESSYFASYEPSPATDQYDIECAVCHTVHSKTGEPLGLRVDETQICSQCHNGELGTSDPVPGSTVRHPQEEMLAGSGLLDVEPSEEPFMGEASCVDCHMPETRAGRQSHRMTPMLPGNAEEWGVPANGDSCTPCHSIWSRSNLQNDIDGWQADIVARLLVADAELAAADLRPAAKTGMGKDLRDRAFTNITFVENDSSFGVHNYPYAVEGLDVAVLFAKAVGATVSFDAPSAPAADGTAKVTGHVAFGDGTDVAEHEVAIQKLAMGSPDWVTVAHAETNEKGGFSQVIKPAGTAEYRAVWAPREGSDIASEAKTINVTPKPPYFTDVPEDNIFYSAVQGLATMNAIGGIAPNLFGPDLPILRAQVAKILVSAMGEAGGEWTNWDNPTYLDVPQPPAQTEADRYPFDFVEKATTFGYVNGVTFDLFEPYNPVTRAQLALMVSRAGGSALNQPPLGWLSPFTDIADLGPEAQWAIGICYYNNIISGKTATSFDPWGNATRAQTSKMIWLLAGLMGKVQ
jgi:predicted CXXCH cytochrome family protein